MRSQPGLPAWVYKASVWNSLQETYGFHPQSQVSRVSCRWSETVRDPHNAGDEAPGALRIRSRRSWRGSRRVLRRWQRRTTSCGPGGCFLLHERLVTCGVWLRPCNAPRESKQRLLLHVFQDPAGGPGVLACFGHLGMVDRFLGLCLRLTSSIL